MRSFRTEPELRFIKLNSRFERSFNCEGARPDCQDPKNPRLSRFFLEELPKLTPEERQEVRLRLAELDQDDWLDEGVLTDVEKNLIESRFRDFEANPQTSLPWEESKARLLAPYTR